MFKKTIAVGPFDPAEFWVTGGGVFTEARHLAGCVTVLGRTSDDAAAGLEMHRESFVADCRIPDMATVACWSLRRSLQVDCSACRGRL